MATKRSKSWFFTTSGDTQVAGFWRRFVGGGISKPTQETFEDLLESIPLTTETSSAASVDSAADLEDKQGLVVIATDANAKSGTNTVTGGSGTATVRPSQLPTSAPGTGTDDTITSSIASFSGVAMSVADDGTSTKNNYIIKLSSAFKTWFGTTLDTILERLFKNGGTAGQVPIKTDGTNYNWAWGLLNVGSQIQGTLPIGNGGTGQTTANTALNALLPNQSTHSGKVLTTDGNDTSWVTAGGLTVTTLSIGAWDMTMSGGGVAIQVPHGVTLDNIRSVSILVYNDALDTLYPIERGNGADGNAMYSIDATNVTILKAPVGSYFDSTDFNDPAIVNRGYITIHHT